MTPPAKPAASGSVSADAKVETPPPPAVEGPKEAPKKTDDKSKTEDPPRFEWKFSLGFGAETMGGRNGGLFAIDNISQFGDFTHYLFNGALMHDFNRGTFRVRGGGQLQFDGTKGNENTGGSSLWNIGLGPRIEFDWKRAYGDGLGGVLVGPASLGIYGILGYGWGTTNVDGGFQLHKQSGFGTAIGADVNVVGFNVGKVHIGADFFAQTNAIYGSDFNNAGWALGGLLTFRPSTKKMTIEKEVPVCDGAKRSIDSYVDSIAELRADNTKVKADLDELKGFLESGADPLTTANIRDALFYREVRQALIKGGSDEKLVREALRKAYIAKKEGKLSEADIDAQIVKDVKDLKPEALATAKTDAEKKYPLGYDFWAQVTGDPVPTELPANVKDLECREIDEWVERLHVEERELTKRNRDLRGRFDTAVLVDALKDHLGKNVEKFVEKVHGFTLDIVQPNFALAKPTDADVARLEEYVKKNAGKTLDPNDSELKKIAKPVFALTEFELGNMKDIADKMNGLKAPSATKYDKVDPNEDKAKYEWMKQVTWSIEGHTDSQGDNAKNQALSERRAKWVKLLLVGFGVAENRLDSIGYGEERQAVPEKGTYAQIQTAQTKNRRVVIRVKGELTSAPINQIPDGKSINVDPNKPPPDGEPKEGSGGGQKPAQKPAQKPDPKPAQKPDPKPAQKPDPKPTPKKDPDF